MNDSPKTPNNIVHANLNWKYKNINTTHIKYIHFLEVESKQVLVMTILLILSSYNLENI